ncbi:unnamed protein product [Spirodela intermedia]|uniref:Polygalacturonase n=1 Tax=Spirodela intermedia TaxID=51605 RepID=A0ABN7EAB4_SPIIN|nr:unnamed protein product [Spirodela intermedia]
MGAQKLLLLLALVLLLRPGDSQKLSPGTANERRRSTLGSASTVRNVKDFGARGDGSSDDTKAFAAAWKAACSSSAPVTVLVPEGKAYRLKPIAFSGPCKSPITVAIKGTILASGRMSDWDGADRRLWMLFDKVDGLRVEGGGTIDGNGPVCGRSPARSTPHSGSRSITATNIVCGPGHGIRYTHLPAMCWDLLLASSSSHPRWKRVRQKHHLQEHRDGQREEPNNHRPELLRLPQRPVETGEIGERERLVCGMRKRKSCAHWRNSFSGRSEKSLASVYPVLNARLLPPSSAAQYPERLS